MKISDALTIVLQIRLNLKGKHRRKQYSKKCKRQISAKGVLCPKIYSIIERQNILTNSQSQNALYLPGYFYFVLWEIKLLISRQTPIIILQHLPLLILLSHLLLFDPDIASLLLFSLICFWLK